jgi:predicted RNA-binding Zn-ribbon protein involved in translation (DUF1610 family)
MSIDTNLHVGPYLVQLKTKETEVEKTIKTCSNDNCQININNERQTSKFCPNCGSPVLEKIYIETEIMDICDILCNNEEFENELSNIDQMGCRKDNIIISNGGSPFDEDRWTEDDDICDLTNVNVQEEIEWFKNEYKTILEAIEKELGENAYEIKYGVIQWYS